MVIHTNSSQKHVSHEVINQNDKQFISREASAFLSKNDYENFIIERGRTVAQRVSELTECPTKYNNTLLPLDFSLPDIDDDFEF